MDYARLYADFIADRRKREHELDEFEIHHVVPRSLGGTNANENLLRLEPGDHLFAHILLAHIHGGPMAIAAKLMLDCGKYQGRASRLIYRAVRRRARRYRSEQMTGTKRGPHRPETLERMSQSAKARGQRIKMTPTVRSKIGAASKSRLQDPRYSDALASGSKQRHSDPDKKANFKARMREVSATPEARARLDRARAIRWAKARGEVVE